MFQDWIRRLWRGQGRAAETTEPAEIQADSSGRVINVSPAVWGREGRAAPTGPRILVADDNRTNRMVLSHILEQAGYNVTTTASGHEALEQLSRVSYRLAILDMHMPGMTGASVIRRFRTTHPRSTIPIVILTANDTLLSRRESADAGADGYLSKPVRAELLRDTVERLIRESGVEVLPGSRAPDDRAETPVLDMTVIEELRQLYHDPSVVTDVIREHEDVGRHLLARIARACEYQQQAVFREAVHELKVNASNIGGQWLMEACTRVENCTTTEFLQRNAQLQADLKEAFGKNLRRPA
jgi:CheY-like chemotaxis protein